MGLNVAWGLVMPICRPFEEGGMMASMVAPVRWRATTTVIWSADRPRFLADTKACQRP